VLAARGVNRASIGVQSFQPHLLAALDRRHGVEHIPRAVELVRQSIPALSFDLIFAAPGQTLADWHADLTTALSHRPDHLSTYGLTYETGTPLWKARRKATVTPVGEDDEAAMYAAGIATLTASGFEHYEVSNFARPGRRSRHNQRYWANDGYYGFGVGAARYVSGSRELNVRDTKLYVRKVLAGEDPTFQRETLTSRGRAFETLAVQLRRLDGIDLAEFGERTGFDLRRIVAERLPMLLEQGLIGDTGVSLKLTPAGLPVADGVIEELLKAE
jgi:oxygen-independent coproporphyrinogen-3 oxidase